MCIRDSPLISGSAITHQAGSSEVVINQPGIYQAYFHSAAVASAGTSIPASVTVRLNANGAPVGGAVASHSFSASDEEANLTFSAAFRATSVPTTIQAVTNNAGFTFDELALTVVRLGDG